MTGYERALEYLRNRGGGAAYNAILTEGYEGDGVDYDRLVESFKANDKAIELLPSRLADLQWCGRNKEMLEPPPALEITVFGRNLTEIRKALVYWDQHHTPNGDER